jgi:hypothetical protein
MLRPLRRSSGGWILDGWGGIHPFGAAAALMDALQTRDRLERGRAPLAEDPALDAIAGAPASYDLAGCGGPDAVIPSRAQDLLRRDYFSHSIAGPYQGASGPLFVWACVFTG